MSLPEYRASYNLGWTLVSATLCVRTAIFELVFVFRWLRANLKAREERLA